MNFEILSINEKARWKNYLAELPKEQQDIYFTPEYYQVYQEYGDGEPFCFVFKSGNNLAVYPFLKKLINNSLFDLDKEYFDIQGAYGYNGIASSSYDKKFIDEFFKCFEEFCIGNKIVAEFTRFHPLIKNYNFSINHMNLINDRKTVILELLKSEEDIWQNEYSKANRNKIRKAEKSNIIISVSNDEADYDEFHKIYSDTMKGLGAKNYYFFDIKFFKNFKLYLNNNQRLFIAKFEQKIVGAMFLMLYGEYAHIHLSGSVHEYLNLGVNNIIKHEAVKYAKSIGAKYFHFGGGNTSNPEDSLFKFKANFSNNRGEFYIGKKIHNSNIYSQICNIWERKYPEKKEKYSNFFLKYRLIDHCDKSLNFSS